MGTATRSPRYPDAAHPPAALAEPGFRPKVVAMIDRFADAVSDRYRIERELGAGGMATVYLADDLKHERKVAIKVLRPELAAVVGGERFLSEIETTANLQHPHILPLFDSGEAGGLLFYVMPYVEGESLQDRLDRERQLPVDEAVRITTDVAEALHAAHQRGVVHRDVKPANILLSGGRPLVADFGIALALSHAGGGRLTETGLSMGTPYYMSPEQASADRDATPASDQYSLACVLYEMLVGEPPFPGGSAQAVLARILTADPTPPSELRRSVPPHLDAVVMRGLEKLPADRFPDLREMVRALRDEGHRYAAGRSRTGERSPRRGPATLVPWTLAAVATILAGAAWLRPGPSVFPADDRRLAIPMQEDAQLPLGQLVPFGVDAGFFAVSPDARTLVHLGYDGDRVRLYRRPLNSYESTIFPGTEGAFWPFFSPDGAWVAYFASTALWKVPVTGGEPVRLADAPNPAGGVWGEDGRILFSIMEGGRLMSVSDAGGQGTLVEAEMTYEAPVQLPGGGLLVAEGPPAEVRLRTADGLWKTVLEGKRPQLLPSGHLTFVRGRTLYAAEFDEDRGELLSEPVPVLEGIRAQGSWAAYEFGADGSLFYVPGENADLGVPVFVDADGVADTLAIPRGLYGHLALSPDERRIVTYEIAGDFALSVLDVRSGRGQLLDRAPSMAQSLWSRAGDRVAYSRSAHGSDTIEIVVRDPSSTLETVLTQSEHELLVSDWSPDDRRLLFAEWTTDRGGEIQVIDVAAGAEPEMLLGGDAEEWGAVFSPDGNWIAYTSDRSGTYEVYVMPYPAGPEAGSVKISSHPVSEEPHWSFEGDAVIYRSMGDWWRVPISFRPRPEPGTPERVMRGAFLNVPGKSWDLLRDGRFLLSDGPRETTFDRIHVIPNFADEVARRIAESRPD